jgi:hypothetical protein
MDTDSLSELLKELFHSDNSVGSDGAFWGDYGMDLSSYTADEINQALEYAAEMNASTDVDAFESSNNISFKASQSGLEQELRHANKDIDYYEKILRREDITDTYRNNCLFRLKQAVKKAAEIAEEISNAKK